MRVALYLRTSHAERTVENQRRELTAAFQARGWPIIAEYADEAISGSKGRDERPGLDSALRAAVAGSYDMLGVWSVDRLGRSVSDLVSTLGELVSTKRALYIHRQQLDTSTPSGRAMFGMLSVFAEFEREMIRERTLAGLARARAAGKRLGPAIKYGPDVRDQLIAARAAGHSWSQLSTTFNIPVRTCRGIINP